MEMAPPLPRKGTGGVEVGVLMGAVMGLALGLAMELAMELACDDGEMCCGYGAGYGGAGAVD